MSEVLLSIRSYTLNPIQKTMLCAVAILLLSACAGIKETGRTIGHTTRDVTKKIGHTSRDAVKAIGKETKEVVKDIKEEID